MGVTLSSRLPGTICLAALLVVSARAHKGEPVPTSKVPWATGEVSVVTGSLPCDGDGCELSVSCPELADPVRARLKVGMAGETPAKGTVLLMTGGGGKQLYEKQNLPVVQQLREAGFQTAQLGWIDSWLVSSPGEQAGHARLGCRPATVARWVYDKIHSQRPGSAYCAAGNSGGSMQIGYMLAFYGLEEVLDTVVPSGGPPSGRLDLSCLGDDPEHEIMRFGIENNARLIDQGFGYPPDGSGPCARKDPSFREKFREASVASGDGDYSYPRTLVWFLFGEKDEPNIRRGKTYHDLLVANESPLVRMDILPGVSHGVQRSPRGAKKILDILIEECRPHSP